MNETGQTIQQTIERWMKAYNSGDTAGVAACYTENAKILPPGAPMMSGREAIQSVWQGAMGMGVKNIRLETVELEENGDTAVEIGNGILTIQPNGGDEFTDNVKYVVVWKKEDGAWRLDTDIWNGSAPAQ
jgi:uncharacterized protein (TIGR02246 family)